MNHKVVIALVSLAVLAGAYALLRAPTPSPEPLAAEAHEEAHEHGEARRTTITPDMAKASGIGIESAGPATLRTLVPLTGKIILNPDTSADVKARYPGIVRKVMAATVGQAVTKGQVLAYVESNDSLQTYAVTSPMNGIILARHASVGDATENETMYVVANLSTVIAEFHIFPSDIGKISTGQTVQIQTIGGELRTDGIITSLLPTADAETQTVLAWAKLSNPENNWKVGMTVQGGAVTEQTQTPLAVATSAIQTMDDQPTVFVQETSATYEARTVQTGRSDGTHTEIRSGLAAGETYVARNSFIIKADIGKTSAAHEH